MTQLILFSLAAALVGIFLPIRFSLSGFLGTALILFLIQTGLKTASGFEGESIETSLLLFNNSWASYIGFNLLVTYRAFAPVLLALAVPLIWRLSRRVS